MPKLKLDKSFTDKLNSINKGKIGKSKSNGNIAGTVSMSVIETNHSRPIPKPAPKHEIFEPVIPQYKIVDSKVVKSDKMDLWDCLSNDTRKILLNELVVKYHFYDNLKINLKSFTLGIFFSFFVIILLRLYDFLIK